MLQHFSPSAPLVLVGCGNMGHAMAMGWLRAGLPPECLFVVDPAAQADRLPGAAPEQFLQTARDLPVGMKARVLVFAVKPQVIESVLPLFLPFVGADTMVLSVAAGVTLKQLEAGLAGEGTYVRVMPNTPAAIGEGISGLTAAADISGEDKRLAQMLMHAVGDTVWIKDEAQMDSVTAVSGSGPAYVFYMVECMAAAGVAEGLPEDVAMKLARETVIGAAKLLDTDVDISAAELRRRVTSPGGTTAAALDVLMHAGTGLGDLMSRAIHAARKRGEELGG
ncbi:MAG: pyrroline-5-carboxylate reductase [Alphaproteobacteria bacterium]|nr:pyrroline-5-carboxylate reductase [Alphaproteobacteria bacterium]